MPKSSDKLAQALSFLKTLQDQGVTAIRSGDVTRTHRERLLRNGFIREVMKGWYISTRPDEPAGESTMWYASFWGFCADYLDERFGDNWCLSPEQSISLHTENWRVPKRLFVRSPKGGNKPTMLLHDTSIMDVRLDLPEKRDMEIKGGMRVMKLPAALVACSPAQFVNRPIEMRSALSMVSDASEILRKLLEGGHSKIAGRLAGGFRDVGRNAVADDIVAAMKAADYVLAETHPFGTKPDLTFETLRKSPYVNRVRMGWAHMRKGVLEVFPKSPDPSEDADTYLKRVDDIYVADAYNSLSIEGYRVSADLIERVRGGRWNPENNRFDREQTDVLAARGYWQAFQAVKNSLKIVLSGENAGAVARAAHGIWYRELFGPSVAAGIMNAADLAGYRNSQVYIRGSMHVPPRHEAMRDLVPALFELLEQEKEPGVRAVLGHFFFVYIHPYVDGNGRMGRFLMNVMLASGGYPWTVTPVEKRDVYMTSLEEASVRQNIEPFARFVASLIDGK